jgi:hypothetical protein
MDVAAGHELGERNFHNHEPFTRCDVRAMTSIAQICNLMFILHQISYTMFTPP